MDAATIDPQTDIGPPATLVVMDCRVSPEELGSLASLRWDQLHPVGICAQCRWARATRTPRYAHRCCATGRARWASREAQVVAAALTPLVESGWRALSMTLRVPTRVGPGAMKRIRARFLAILRARMRSDGVAYQFVSFTEVGADGRPHDHGLLVVDKPVRFALIRALWRAAVGSPTATYVAPARSVAACIRYGVKDLNEVRAGRRRVGLMAWGVPVTWGTLARLYQPHGGKAALWRRICAERHADPEPAVGPEEDALLLVLVDAVVAALRATATPPVDHAPTPELVTVATAEPEPPAESEAHSLVVDDRQSEQHLCIKGDTNYAPVRGPP